MLNVEIPDSKEKIEQFIKALESLLPADIAELRVALKKYDK